MIERICKEVSQEHRVGHVRDDNRMQPEQHLSVQETGRSRVIVQLESHQGGKVQAKVWTIGQDVYCCL